MVRIRLRRVGRKKQPSYRIVVADSRSPRDGRYIEVIGFYNPRTEPATMTIKEDRALYWLSVGAQPSEAVQRILNKLGTQARFERLMQGEELEALVAEAEAEFAEREPVSPKTSYPATKKKAAPAPVAETTEPEPEEAPAKAEETETAEAAEEPEEMAQADVIEETEETDEPAQADAAEETEEAAEADDTDAAETD
jgi:small subunit ribosomal protein S16